MRIQTVLSLAAVLALSACPGDDTDETDTDVYDTGDTDTDDTDVTDTTPPTVAITDNVSGSASGDVTFTFTFSEDVGDSFTADDVTVDAGTKGAFSADGTTATLVVTPPEASSGTLTVDVATGTFEDLAGNANLQGASTTQDYDTTVEVTDTVLVDFELESVVITGFGGVLGSTDIDPNGSGSQVGILNKIDSAETWAGGTVHYCANKGIVELPFDADHTRVTLKVWSPDAGTPIRVKVENSRDETVSVETETLTTTAAAWETLSFDFTNHADGTAALDLDATYDKISVFPDFGTAGADAGDKTWYVDDITFPGAVFATDCPELPDVENILTNPGFEDWPTEGLATDWLIFPGDLNNYAKVCTGDPMFNTEELFTAYEGDCAIKMYGRFDTGNASETPIYQEFTALEGETWELSAWMYMHEADAIEAADTEATLWIKFFDDSYTYYGNAVATPVFTDTTPTGTWTEVKAVGTVPAGATKVQAALEFLHCNGRTMGDCYTGGGVYFDDVKFGKVEE